VSLSELVAESGCFGDDFMRFNPQSESTLADGLVHFQNCHIAQKAIALLLLHTSFNIEDGGARLLDNHGTIILIRPKSIYSVMKGDRPK
jgi:hypothetical protein